MITVLFAIILILAVSVALMNWRHGWMAAIVCGVLQDPFRKLTPGTPPLMSMSIVVVYLVILFAAAGTLYRNRRDFMQRFPNVYSAAFLVVIFLFFGALRGVATFGISAWKVPAFSLLVYCIPIPAVLLGYSWLTREEQLTKFFIFYTALTSVALVGTVLEYLNVKLGFLGMVAMPWGYLRHLPGIQIRILSGIYRAPDIMAWHAATLTIIAIAMAVRAQVLRRAWPWLIVAGWGFLNCLISGRRKAIYMVAAFGLAFFWRYFRRLTMAQISSVIAVSLVLTGVVYFVGGSEQSSVYTRGAKTTGSEIFARLDGGTIGTLQQNGVLGKGLGAATQGVRHVLGTRTDIGWQEGGLAKLVAELGLPGTFVIALLALAVFRMMLRITAVGDIEGTSQIIRVALFAIVVANGMNFLASAQAYSDPVLGLSSAFFLGCLFATATLDERVAAERQRAGAALPAPATA